MIVLLSRLSRVAKICKLVSAVFHLPDNVQSVYNGIWMDPLLVRSLFVQMSTDCELHQ